MGKRERKEKEAEAYQASKNKNKYIERNELFEYRSILIGIVKLSTLFIDMLLTVAHIT